MSDWMFYAIVVVFVAIILGALALLEWLLGAQDDDTPLPPRGGLAG